MIANEKEFDEALNELGQLYENGKMLIQKLQYEQQTMDWRATEQCYEFLYTILKEMRDLSAVTMQKLHFKIEN
jgi:hypothetical protein